jgi:hypothetical protein
VGDECDRRCLSLSVVFIAAVAGKELVIRDKRLSAMITCLLTIVAQWIAHGVLTLYDLPR